MATRPKKATTRRKSKASKSAPPVPIGWHAGIDKLMPSIVKILTPDSSGSGVFLARGLNSTLCAVATAAHVVDHALYWEQPIRIYHPHTNKTELLHFNERAIIVRSAKDEAIIIFEPKEIVFPDTPIPLYDKKMYLKPGVEVGWLGFPGGIPKAGLCFFSGPVSSYILKDTTYLVDGVAIHGVSGGPAFRIIHDQVELIGVVSKYYANRNTGESLPGLAAIVDVEELHNLADTFRTLDQAQKKQEVPPVPPPEKKDATKPNTPGQNS